MFISLLFALQLAHPQMGTSWVQEVWRTGGAASFDSFGAAMVASGDLNGDGSPERVFG